MGSRCIKANSNKIKSLKNDIDLALSPPLKRPEVRKKQSIIKTTDDVPDDHLPITITKLNSMSPQLPPHIHFDYTVSSPRTIIHTNQLQKRRNSEVLYYIIH